MHDNHDRVYPLIKNAIYVYGSVVLTHTNDCGEGYCDICRQDIKESTEDNELVMQFPILSAKGEPMYNTEVWIHMSCFEEMSRRINDAIQEHIVRKMADKGM